MLGLRFASDAVSTLLIGPLIVTWVTNGIQPLRTTSRWRYLEACAVFLGLLAVSYGVLYELRSGADLALLFVPLPFLLWAAIRFGVLGASTAISVVSFLAIWSASYGHGPFAGETAEQSALSIEIFLIG